MRWIKLDGKKDPPFGKKCVIGWIGNVSIEAAYLDKVETTESGKDYTFKVGETTYNNPTHYFIPDKLQKENP